MIASTILLNPGPAKRRKAKKKTASLSLRVARAKKSKVEAAPRSSSRRRTSARRSVSRPYFGRTATGTFSRRGGRKIYARSSPSTRRSAACGMGQWPIKRSKLGLFSTRGIMSACFKNPGVMTLSAPDSLSVKHPVSSLRIGAGTALAVAAGWAVSQPIAAKVESYFPEAWRVGWKEHVRIGSSGAIAALPLLLIPKFGRQAFVGALARGFVDLGYSLYTAYMAASRKAAPKSAPALPAPPVLSTLKNVEESFEEEIESEPEPEVLEKVSVLSDLPVIESEGDEEEPF